MYILQQKFPNALNVRFEGKCPSCKQKGLQSFQLPEDAGIVRGKDRKSEQCAYFCYRCGWGNAGTRPIELRSTDRKERL